MKKLLFALVLFFIPAAASAQCNGVFPNSTVCGNATGSSNTPRPTSPSAFQGSAGGTNGQIQYNNSGALDGFTASGDATVNPTTGAVTFTTVNSSIGTFSGLCLSLTANGKGLITSIIRGICGINAQTASYPIATSDCGGIVTESGGPFTVTLPAASGFSSGCKVQVCNINPNASGQRGVSLSGFPSPIFLRLYMGQCVEVTNIAASSWQASIVPGRFHPSWQIGFQIDNGGSDSNDGQISNAAANALQHVAACLQLIQLELDLSNGVQPTCSPTGGQTFSEALAITGPLVGGSVFNLSGNGGQAILQVPTLGSAVMQLNDFAPYMISLNVTFDCTGGSAGCTDIVLHQQSGVDLNQGTILKGSAVGHEGISCDSHCKINIGAAPLQATGTFNYVATLDEGSTMNVNSGITLTSPVSLTGGVINADHNSQFMWHGALIGGSPTLTVGEIFTLRDGAVGCVESNFSTSGTFTGTRQWSVLNNALFGNISSTAIPGTTPGINTAATFAAGIIINSGLSSGGC